MIDLIERIGPYLGIVAFLGLAILAFLIFQQAREVRRLREWAGRAPERADEAAEASLAAAEARGEVVEAETEAGPGRLAVIFERVRSAAVAAWQAVDRNAPVDPRYLLGFLLAALIAAGVLTSGFGLIGEDEGRGGAGKGQKREKKPEVAVLNATQTVDPDTGVEIQGVRDLAARVAERVVEEVGYEAGRETNAASGADQTVVMFDEVGDEAAAEEFAAQIDEQLGETPVEPMSQEVRERARGAPLALVVGADDEGF